MERCDAVIVAAGSGRRLGLNTPKAFVPLGGKPLVSYSVEVFVSHPAIGKIIIAVPPEMTEQAADCFTDSKITVAAGGAERWESVRNGCRLSDAEWVLVHDAARPFLTVGVIDGLLALAGRFECAFTAVAVTDTIRTFTGEIAGETIDRSTLVRVGTPQLFRRSCLERCFELAAGLPSPPTDEIFLIQKLGFKAGIAWGDPKNFKITTREDLEIAEALVERKKKSGGAV